MIVSLLLGWVLLSLICVCFVLLVFAEDLTSGRIKKYKLGRMYFSFKKNWSRLLYVIGVVLAMPVVLMIQFCIWLGKDAS